MSMRFVCFFIIIFLSSSVFVLDAQMIRYVRVGATGEGRSWNNASGSIQAMIDASQPGDAVYVAAGTYYAYEGGLVEDEEGRGELERKRAFLMKAGVKVFGGFCADTAIAVTQTPETRRKKDEGKFGWQLADVSLLSGASKENRLKDSWHWDDVAKRWTPGGYIGDNAVHVVWFATNGFETLVVGEATPARSLTQEAVLDGFTIAGGSADGMDDEGIQGHSARFGGGVYLVDNGVLRNCIVRENYSLTRGGGVFCNNGGLVSDCLIERNTSPGNSVNRNGFGGGVYCLSRGRVERSFIVNNDAKIGAGIYLAKDISGQQDRLVVEMSVIANNTAAQDAGGIYCDKAGVLTGLIIAKNNTFSLDILGNGHTGGVYCNEFGVLTNCVLWGNFASSNTQQYYGVNVRATDAGSKIPASVQLTHCAVGGLAYEYFGNAQVSYMEDLTSQNVAFKKEPLPMGVIHEGDYFSLADWDKQEYSLLYRKGATAVEAPWVGADPVTLPDRAIDGTVINGRHDIGAYFTENITVNPAKVGNKWVVYVDNQAEERGDGSSWTKPLPLITPAIRRLESLGGGEIWVKEGEYIPVVADNSNDPRMFSLNMGNKVNVYGGFPQSVRVPLWQQRDPVRYRTVLNGDMGVKGDAADNSYHLVYFGPEVIDGAIVDGLHLVYGNALNDESCRKGAGIRVEGQGAVIRNCMIENCKAANGAGIWSVNPVKIENCVINNNEVTGGLGAAVLDLKEGSQVVNVTVIHNKGVGVALPEGVLKNSVICGNTGDEILTQVQVTGTPEVSYCAVQGQGYGATQCNILLPVEDIAANMLHFTNPTTQYGVVSSGYATLLGGVAVFEPTCLSELVNRGSNTDAPAEDIAGVSRLRGGRMDIGAYQSTCMPEGNVRYVRHGAVGDGLSWETASGDLQAMVDALGVKEVWVAAGEYSGNFVMKEGVNVYGGFPAVGTPGMTERRSADQSTAYCTVLDGQANGTRVLTQNNDYTTLTVWDGFTIRNGKVGIDDGEDGGAGAKIWRNGKLRNCIITGNSNEYKGGGRLRGGGIHCRGGVLENCYISNNEVKAINGSGSAVGETYGGGIYMTAGEVYNCVISANQCVGAYADGCAAFVENASFYNNTIVKNTGTGSTHRSVVRIGDFKEAGLSVVNCIIYGNNAGEVLFSNKSDDVKVVTYSLVEGKATGEGNIAGDPMFVDMENNDFRLREGSPCVNSGDARPLGITLPETDMDDTERIKDCAVDMGAYELGREEKVVAGNVSGNRVAYVLRDGAGNAWGDSWANAACATKLQKVIDEVARLGGGEVWVGTGVGVDTADFYPTRQVNGDVRNRSIFVPSGVRLLGGFTGTENNEDDRPGSMAFTRLNGDIRNTPDDIYDNVYHVAVVEEGGILEGFRIYYGNADHVSQPEYRQGGGVMIKAGGSVRNCWIRYCLALGDGAGVYLVGKDASVTGSVISDNITEGEGGGVYAGQHSNLTGNTIVRNTAGQGGGVGFYFPIRMIGCVVWGNKAGIDKNLSGNTENTYEIITGSGKRQISPVSYSAIEGVRVSGLKNIRLSSRNTAGEQSPEFVSPDKNNWDLMIGSALVDAGIDNEVSPELTTEEDFYFGLGMSHWDLVGRQRVKRADTVSSTLRMDIGAYEADFVITPPPGVERLYVSRTAKGKGDGTSWENSMGDLSLALDYFARNPGVDKRGEIWVQGGYSYVPSHVHGSGEDINDVSFMLPDHVAIYGGFRGPVEDYPGEASLDEREYEDQNQNGIISDFEFKYLTVLDGAFAENKHAYHVVTYTPAGTTGGEEGVILDGLYIRGGRATGEGEKSRGAGVYATGKIKIQNCRFYENNSKGGGAAVYSEQEATIVNSVFAGNVSEGKNGIINVKNGVVANTLVFNNEGGGVVAEHSRLLNLTVVRNKAGGVYLNGGMGANLLVWGNEGGELIQENGAVSTYCAVEGGVAGEGNIALTTENNHADGPQFYHLTTECGVAGYDLSADWTVKPLSVVVDAGSNAVYSAELPRTVNGLIYAGDTEITKIERISNERVDIGAYEYAQVHLLENACRLYVRPTESFGEKSDGSSWEKATVDLQGAIEAMERSTCSGVKEIWVAQGVYMPRKYRSEDPRSRSFVVASGGFKLYGGFPDDGAGGNPEMKDRDVLRYATVLDGSATESYSVMIVEGSKEVLVDGFVVRGGKAMEADHPDNFGAGMYVSNSKATINKCVFTENITDFYYGALGLYHGAAVNCLFVNNIGVGVSVFDGKLDNSTSVCNTYGFCAVSDAAVARNDIFWGNTEGSFKSWKSAHLNACGVQGEIPSGYDVKGVFELSENNMDRDGPHFVHPEPGKSQSFELGCGSSLISAWGIEVDWTGETDLAGKPRVLDRVIDIGAFESRHGDIPIRPDYKGSTVACGGNELVLKVNNTVQNTEIYWMREGIDMDMKWNAGQITVGEEMATGVYLYRAIRVDTLTQCQSREDSIFVTVGSVAVPKNLAVMGNDTVCAGDAVVFTFEADDGTMEVYDGDVLLEPDVYVIDGNRVTVNAVTPGVHFYNLRLRRVLSGFGECTSRKSDSVSCFVRALPGLTNNVVGSIRSGERFQYIPEFDIQGTVFTWQRSETGEEFTGTDSIDEVLTYIAAGTGSRLYTYDCMLSAHGCTARAEVKVNVQSLMLNIEPIDNCSTTVRLNLSGVSKVNSYRVLDESGMEKIKASGGLPSFVDVPGITKPQSLTVAVYSGANCMGNLIAESSVWVWGGASAPASVTAVGVDCYGEDVVLILNGDSYDDYRVVDNGVDLLPEEYQVDGNRITVKMPSVNKHVYEIYSRMTRPNGIVCESSGCATCTLSITTGESSFVAEGETTVRSGEQTNIVLKSEGIPVEATWWIKSKAEKIQIATGEMRGDSIRLILLNTASVTESIVLWVEYQPVGSGCPILQELTIWVEPIDAKVEFVREGTWPELICAGDEVNLTYRLSRGVGVTVSGLPAGVTMIQERTKITLQGKVTSTFTYTLTPEEGEAKVETLDVKPSPEFEFGM